MKQFKTVYVIYFQSKYQKKKIRIFQFDGNTTSCLLLNFKTKEFQIILLCHVEDYKILITWISKRHQTTVSVII